VQPATTLNVKVLVAYATRHGSTRGIAERIAERLRARGLEAEARTASEVRDASRYEAFVVGGAAYMFHWLGDATKFVERNRATLAARPNWLFSSGPIGTDTVDKEGRPVLEGPGAEGVREATRARSLARRSGVLRGHGPDGPADRDCRALRGPDAGGARRDATRRLS
jgi:menaquinone-dependent protoporphyrinogen oxidase